MNEKTTNSSSANCNRRRPKIEEAGGVIVDLMGRRPNLLNVCALDLVTPASNPAWSWMFVFVIVFSRCQRLKTCSNINVITVKLNHNLTENQSGEKSQYEIQIVWMTLCLTKEWAGKLLLKMLVCLFEFCGCTGLGNRFHKTKHINKEKHVGFLTAGRAIQSPSGNIIFSLLNMLIAFQQI